jgi:hypothetical protein
MFRGDGETVAHATVIAKMMGLGYFLMDRDTPPTEK